ncbi:MAG: hypothetical protein WD646_07315 [Actinomycetota bacterium]
MSAEPNSRAKMPGWPRLPSRSWAERTVGERALAVEAACRAAMQLLAQPTSFDRPYVRATLIELVGADDERVRSLQDIERDVEREM